MVFLTGDMHQVGAYELGGAGSGIYEISTSPFDASGTIVNVGRGSVFGLDDSVVGNTDDVVLFESWGYNVGYAKLVVAHDPVEVRIYQGRGSMVFEFLLAFVYALVITGVCWMVASAPQCMVWRCRFLVLFMVMGVCAVLMDVYGVLEHRWTER